MASALRLEHPLGRMTLVIILSSQAVDKLKSLLQNEKKPGFGLRVSVVGGGCSGLSYKLDFQEAPAAEDEVIEQNGIRVFLDPKSAPFVTGMTLNYEGGLNGTGFSFQNPNATKSCGCGSSFAV